MLREACKVDESRKAFKTNQVNKGGKGGKGPSGLRWLRSYVDKAGYR